MPAPRMTTSPAQPAPIDHIRLWFDPTCPWAWLTYLWLRQTQRSGRDFTLDLAVMSLAILNENNPDAPHRYKYPQAQSLQLGRVLVAATQAAENRTSTDVLGSMYDSLGAYVHHEGGRDYDLANREALAAANLPTHLAELATATTYDQVLRANTTAAFAIVGPGGRHARHRAQPDHRLLRPYPVPPDHAGRGGANLRRDHDARHRPALLRTQTPPRRGTDLRNLTLDRSHLS